MKSELLRLTVVGVLVGSVAAPTAPAQSTVPPPPPAPPYETVFYTHDGLRLEAYFYRPAGNGPFPFVVYNHGSALPGQERVERPVGFIGGLLQLAGYAVLVPERRGYGKSEGATFAEEVGSDRGSRFVARLAAEADDLLAAAEHVTRDPSFRVDPLRRALMGWSFGGIVTTLAVSGRSDYRAAIIQAPGSLTWDQSPQLRAALSSAAHKIVIPIQCLVAENDATTDSARTICGAAKGAPAELKVYPPFTPTGPIREGVAPGHALFGPQGVSVWKGDVLAFLARHLQPPQP
jgi:dienelactone hydrolase